MNAFQDGAWRLQAGDPTLLGWATLAGYMLGAWACWRAWRACRFGAQMLERAHAVEASHQRRLAAWWLGVGLLMLALGANKELDLQLLLGDMGKQLALEQGWYAQRRTVQLVFVTVFGCVLVAGLGIAGFLLRRLIHRIWPAIVGVALVLAYAGARAAIFHTLHDNADSTLASRLWILELVGIALVAWSALRASRPLGRAAV
jgi:hypothetical protein